MKTLVRVLAIAGLVFTGLFGLGLLWLVAQFVPAFSAGIAALIMAGVALYFWLRRRRGGPSESAGAAGKVGLL